MIKAKEKSELPVDFQLLVASPTHDHFWDPFAKGFPMDISAKLYVQLFSFNFSFKYAI